MDLAHAARWTSSGNRPLCEALPIREEELMTYAPNEAHTPKPYRAPELAGPIEVRKLVDDVTRQPGTMVALLLVVAILFGLGLFVASQYVPSPFLEAQAPTTATQSPMN
jgi:hypothetical protein